MRRRRAGCLRSRRRLTAACEQAAKIGGMVHQTLQDRLIRFNEHKAFLARLVEEGPIPQCPSRAAIGRAWVILMCGLVLVFIAALPKAIAADLGGFPACARAWRCHRGDARRLRGQTTTAAKIAPAAD
jgi:hypothetical protein